MVTVTRRMIQLVDCPKCGAKSEESCGHRKNKMISHHERMHDAQLLFNNPHQWSLNKSGEEMFERYWERVAKGEPKVTMEEILKRSGVRDDISKS